MKAFISFSVNDNNQYLISLLSFKLQDNDFSTSTSNNFFSKELDFTTKYSIQNAHLFLGVITDDGLERKRVLEEWEFAKNSKVPNILLIEDTVPVKKEFKGNWVRFNRLNPQAAIDKVSEKMNSKPSKSNSNSDILPWLLGGAAVLAILGLMTTSKD